MIHLRNLPLFGLTAPRVATLVALTIGAAVLEGFGIAMFLPVLEYVEKGQTLAALAERSAMWRALITVFEFGHLPVTLFSLVAVAVSVMLIRVLVVYARQTYFAWLAQESQHAVRSRLFEQFLAMSIEKSSLQPSGQMINMLTIETQRAASSLSALFGLSANAAVCIGFVAVLLALSWPLTLLASCFLAISATAVFRYARHTRRYSYAATSANDRYARMVLDRLTGLRLIKLTATQDREASRVAEASREVRDLLFWLSRMIASVDLIMEPLVLVSGGAILYLAVSEFGMSLAEIGIFLVVLLRLLPLAKEVVKSRQAFNASAGSLSAVLDSHAAAVGAVEGWGGPKIFTGINVAIEFVDVSYIYPGMTVPAVSGINVSFPAGKVTALVGPSGAGKTTLVDLIPGLRSPTSGSVRFDGVSAGEFQLDSLRRSIGFVSQDAVLIDDTVANNLRFACPSADDQALWDALSGAQAAEFVHELSGKLEARLGERGALLSGGQRQRLALARALVQKPSILILDEPTSALDSETEYGIQSVIDELRRGGKTTIIIIAHRLSTIRNSDCIVVLQEGRVTEEGLHDELATNEAWYARAAGLQTVAI